MKRRQKINSIHDIQPKTKAEAVLLNEFKSTIAQQGAMRAKIHRSLASMK